MNCLCIGYMSPEYATGGIFSEKSDVYSSRVLILAIISGRNNTSFYYFEKHLGVLAYVSSHSKSYKLSTAESNKSSQHTRNFVGHGTVEWRQGIWLGWWSIGWFIFLIRSDEMRAHWASLFTRHDNAADRPTVPDVLFIIIIFFCVWI